VGGQIVEEHGRPGGGRDIHDLAFVNVLRPEPVDERPVVGRLGAVGDGLVL